MSRGNFTNITDIDFQESLGISEWLQIISYTVVCLVGLIGNTLVIYVVGRFSKMQTVTNMYIVNLAIADECFLVGIPFLLVTMIHRGWIFGPTMCKIYMISTSINQFTSSILLTIMSADRYIAVCHPISSPRWRTPLISKLVSLFAWCFSLMLMFPIIQHTREHVEESKASCIIDWDNDADNNSNNTESSREFGGSIFIIYSFLFSFAIPLCMTTVFYCMVIMKLKTVGPKNKSKEKRRSHRKVTNLVLTVVAVYIFCWLPYWVMQLVSLMEKTKPPTKFLITIHLLTGCLCYSNSAVNPILYAFLSDNFKKSFLRACSCATGKDINATLHLENSVFPRKNKQGSDRYRTGRGTSICPNNEDECDMGPLVIKGDPSTSAITMTSRTNITSLGDSNDGISRCGISKNGNALMPPTTL